MFEARFRGDWKEGSHSDGQGSDCKWISKPCTLQSHTSSLLHKGFSKEEEMKAKAGLDMLKFSMANCLINFGPDYFQYGKEENPLKKVLTIGGFDSAWLADLVACYILEKLNMYGKEFAYFKNCCDD